MVLKKLKTSDLSELDTKQRILESAIHLFALKGFDGASVREIACLANVNVAALNYHFRSKENLRQEILEHIINDFRTKINSIGRMSSAAEYAVKVYEAMTEDSAKCLNQFKLILEADTHACDSDPYPMGYEQFSVYLNEELKASVPETERGWFVNVVFSYIVHISVMSSTNVGKRTIEKFFPKKKHTIPSYIEDLVKALIRDLNLRYP